VTENAVGGCGKSIHDLPGHEGTSGMFQRRGSRMTMLVTLQLMMKTTLLERFRAAAGSEEVVSVGLG
jgi:hypothetical protein